jgi:5-methylcytosine-specific restriction endonuclease McrA
MNRHYPAVATRAGHRCEYCRAPEAIFNFAFEVEHIVPVSQGGMDDLENMCLACRSCNLFKSDHTTGIMAGTSSATRLFHPRHHAWDDHFRINGETGNIEGKTDVGEGTVARLQMNTPLQLAARRAWMQLGLFP